MRLYSVKSCTPVLVTAKAPSTANPLATQSIELQSTTFHHTTEHHLDEQHAAVTRSTTKASRSVVEPPSAFATHDDVSTLSSSSSVTTTTTLNEATWETIMDATTDDIIIPECIVLSAERNERLECSSFPWARPLLVFTEEKEDEDWTAAPTTISSDEEIGLGSDNNKSSFPKDSEEWVTFSGFPGFIDTLVYQDTVSL